MPMPLIVLMLSLLLGIQPVTTDLYLPALPMLTGALGGSTAQGQLTLSALLLAFGISQLFWGPLSDRIGRRPVLIWGLGTYALAAVICTLSPSMEVLIAGRTLQGVAMGASVMCARAIVRDLYASAHGAYVMSKSLSGVGVLAALAVPLGSLVSTWLGWRMTLLLPGLFALATLALVVLRFRESIPARDPHALRPRALMATWGRILRHPGFLSFSSLTAASYGGLFTLLASSPFILMKVLGMSRGAYGIAMFSTAAFYIAGTFLCRRLLVRFGINRALMVGGLLSLSGGSLAGGLALAGINQVWAILGPCYLYMLGHGIHHACGQSGAVAPFPRSAGTAAALNGFMMMLLVFAIGAWLGRHMDGTVLPLTNGLWCWSVVTALLAWFVVPRNANNPNS